MSERWGRQLMRDREKKRKTVEREREERDRWGEEKDNLRVSHTCSLIDGRKRSQVLIGHDEKTNA